MDTMKTILIEGWRGIHQSLAVVNQYQLVELAGLEGISVKHRDLAFSVPEWNKVENRVDFPKELQAVIDSVAAPETDEQFDAVYRIAIPFDRSDARAKRSLSFIVSEFGLRQFQFGRVASAVDHFCRDGSLVVTPSQWSRTKLLEYGFREEDVRVVPHGVREDVFYPLQPSEKHEVRADLGIPASAFVFLNLSSLTREKGLDILVQAFSAIRQRHDHAFLMLKDTRELYKNTLEGFFQYYTENFGPLPPQVLQSICIVESKLDFSDMRKLYGAADYYVSPYRAEGFNLPVIEAIACGVPVIVTEGGATDDFCDKEVALKIESRRIANADRCEYFGKELPPGYHLEPGVDSLIERMDQAIRDQTALRPAFDEGRRMLIRKYSWQQVTRQLSNLF
jgi:glycosyltransferase involved in cell wall biosynthesis